MPDEIAISQVILDPSFLFTDDAIELLRDELARPFLVISDSLGRLMDSAANDDIARAQLETVIYLADGDDARPGFTTIWSLTEGLRRFSYRESLELSGEIDADLVRFFVDNLRSPEPATIPEEFLMDITADEYAFMVSHSIGMFVGRGWERIKGVGIQITEVSQDAMESVLQAVRRVSSLLRQFLIQFSELATSFAG